MKSATRGQLKIRSIAEMRLKEGVSPRNYETALAFAMHESARDLGFELPDDPAVIAEDLSRRVLLHRVSDENATAGSTPAHILGLCDLRIVSEPLAKLCRKGAVYSLFALETGHAVNDFAERLSDRTRFCGV